MMRPLIALRRAVQMWRLGTLAVPAYRPPGRIERWIGDRLYRWARTWPERPVALRDFTWRQRLARWWLNRGWMGWVRGLKR